MGFFHPTRVYFTYIWRHHHYRWRATNFYLYSVLIAIEQLGFFNMPHLLWHGPSLYNCHLRRPVTLTLLPSVWRWSCHYLYLFYRLYSRPEIELWYPACEANALPLSHRDGVSFNVTIGNWTTLCQYIGFLDGIPLKLIFLSTVC